ncbi:hypothetical protein PMY56_02270 [Clostridium tertium]|jgi:hypothetical protein|uniref:Twitching motility protein PilT n=1 Tax=Clostridium tertium TaxID=1559 RepID=A0A9X3XGK6_9CLOT|nr:MULTISPECIES: hypothetical protein [Clostridium]EEH96890.1 hypothetical protein CSBG_00516 [Clostridium sp. 7_2_43FAA]MBP1868412.1 hypothetical protein [Clostridium tertium]MBS5308246.1 hypothetical protein [Clostridium sp.]MBS5886382.1 hypothetical protein [Clostridium sp.]MBS6501083.1 hypothetical protein [Clostridium sp.]
MIQVFCAKRGAGKTKRLIELANEHLSKAKGDSVYIDDDARRMMQLKGKIRFINTNELGVIDCDSFYGLLCGVISQNYDVENIYIDALSSIVTKNMSESAKLFGKLKEFSQKFNLNLYINLNCECSDELPDLIREYVA